MTFEYLMKEYQILLGKKKELIDEFEKPQSDIVKRILQQEIKDMDKKIKDFENQKLYTASQYQNAGAQW